MLDRLTANLDYHGRALMLRADRQQVLAANIANADTPDYQARDFDFGRALADATKSVPNAGAAARLPVGMGTVSAPTLSMVATDARHAGAGTGAAGSPELLYRTAEQAAGDRNTVELDRERANFADNAVRYEATLRFVNSSVRQTLSAIRGD